MKLMRSHLIIAGALLLSGFSATVSAQILGPVYPAPGGNAFSSSGTNAISATGRTQFYSGFNLAASDELWWTFFDIDNPRVTGQASTGDMSFSGWNAGTGIATWLSTANTSIPLAIGGSVSTGTKLVMQLQPFTGSGNSVLGAGWLTPTTAGTEGIPGFSSGHVFADVIGDFQVWFQYQTSSGTALGSYYDSLATIQGNQLITSTVGGFYYTAIPEPSTYAALVALGVLGGTIWRRKQIA